VEWSGAKRVFMRRPERRRKFGRPGRRWENNINMDLQEVGWGSTDWMALAQDRNWWWALANAVTNLRVPYNAGTLLTSRKPTMGLRKDSAPRSYLLSYLVKC
jgi:hypothetical protein